MKSLKNNQMGFGAVELAVVVIVLVLLGAGAWIIYERQTKTSQPNTSSTHTNTTGQTSNTSDPTTSWKRVESLGGAYSIKVPDGWVLTKYPGNVVNGDSITYTAGKPAVITTASSTYAGDQKKFNVVFTDNQSAANTVPQWQSPNPYGTEATEDFSIGNIQGKRYSITYTQTVTGVTKGDKVYQYVFDLPNNKSLGVVYIQYAGDADNLKTVEQAIKTIVVN